MNTTKFREFDYSTISDKLCSPQTFVRILKEISDTNDDFKTLRTIIKETETVGVLHFVQYPADGALADKPIFGRIIVTKYYPSEAPVVHIFTKTDRYNVDVFHSNCYSLNGLSSSVCFDILTTGYGGTWNPEYTISALLASLLQAIVSSSVPQKYGPDIKEFVSMEKLTNINRQVQMTYDKYKGLIPAGRIIEKTTGFPIKTVNVPFSYNVEAGSRLYPKLESVVHSTVKGNPNPVIMSSKGFKLNEGPFSVLIDCSELNVNPSTVFSIILGTNKDDLFGTKKDTILFRNGVTGTAATKEQGKPILWFYHGIPLNDPDGLLLNVTITDNQFVISYKKEDKWLIHGDYPVAYFRDQILFEKTFYLSVYMKNKNSGYPVNVRISNSPEGYIQNLDEFVIV
jgi:ubiquitin-protein ligase